MKKIYRADIGAYTNDEYLCLLETLPDSVTAYLSQKALLDDRKRSLLGQLFIRRAALEFCGEKDPRIAYTALGKPYFPDLALFFSVSHSQDRVIAAVSDRPIGADIEKIGAPDFRIADRFFTQAESRYVGNDPVRFYEIWTKKEAAAKARGIALSDVFGKDMTALPFYTECDGEYFLSVYEENEE